jgi:uncharacterized protein (DUF4415 family)
MSKKLPADFPKTAADWEAVIAAAPGEDRPLTPKEKAQFDNAVVVRGGNPKTVREALVRRTRGKGKKPAKELVSLRIPPDLLARWKATGEGWQTRMVERLSIL